MADIQLTPKDILSKQFKHAFRGFDIVEVDAFLDLIIRDYEAFQKEISFLQGENERLLQKVDELSKQASFSKASRSTSVGSAGVTNFDILKRLSNLEKEVFGSKLDVEEATHEVTPSPKAVTVLEETEEDLDKTRVITPIKD